MTVHILCGPARSGKTERMLERFRERFAVAPASVLWLAPTVRAVEALRRRLGDEASDRPRLHTFHEMLQAIIKANEPAAHLLTDVQRRLLTEDLVAGLCADDRLAHFSGVADTRGFTDGVLGLFADLQRHAVPVERFTEAATAAGPKERQCAHLYAEYQLELKRQNLHDADGAAARASEILRRGLRQPFAEVRAAFVDGFSDFTRPQHEILQGLSAWVEELWIALPNDDNGQRMDLFARPRATLERLRTLRPEVEWLTAARHDVERPAGLAHLASQLFQPIRAVKVADDASGVSLIEAPGVVGEARLVVRRIKKLLRDGAAADDLLVVLRDVPPYADILTEVFDEYAVPVEIDATKPLTRNPATAVLLRAMRLPDDDWPFAGVTALLRNTYFRPLWPEATERPDLPQRSEVLLRLLGEPRGRDAYLKAVTSWAEKQEPGLEDEQAEASLRLRKHELAKECLSFLRRFFQAWETAPAKAPLAEHIAWLRFFAEDVGIAEAAKEDVADAAALEHLWREASQWLDREERRNGSGGRALDRKTFYRRLSALAAETGLPRSPTERGRVRVLSANQARHLEADMVFIMGLGERSFPRLTPPLSLLDDQEMQALQSAERDDGAVDLLPEEMLLFYQVVSRARRELVLSYPAVDPRGQNLLPSSFLLAVRACFHPDAFKGKVERQQMLIQGIEAEPLSAAEIRVHAAKNYKAGGLTALSADLRANLQDAGKLYEKRFQSKKHNVYDGLLRDPAVVGQFTTMFGPERVFSPTALEEYVSCPFRFFLHHVLHLETLEEPSEEIEVTRRGQAYHRAMARLHRKLKASGVHEPTDAVTQEVMREMDEAVEEDVRRAPSPAAKELWRLEGRRLVRTAERYVDQWRKFLKPWLERGVSPQPDLFEADFGLPSEDGTPWIGPLVVRIDDVEVRVSGRIDRVDVVELDDGVGFWIIDYKTGSSSHYTGKDLAEYKRLQLTLYALAVEEVLLAGRAARPLGLAYWMPSENGPKIALPGRTALQWLDDDRRWRTIREDLRQWIAALVRNMRQGNFVLQPRDDNCTQTCSFGQTCRITQARGVAKEGMLPLPMTDGAT